MHETEQTLANAFDALAEKAYRAGWMQGWIESGAAAPPNPGCIPKLPDNLRYEAPAAPPVKPTSAGYDMLDIRPNSAIIYKRVGVSRASQAHVVKVARLPEGARLLQACVVKWEHDHKTPEFEVGLHFFVPDDAQKRLTEKRYIFAPLDGGFEDVAGANARNTGLHVFDQELPYFIFECM